MILIPIHNNDNFSALCLYFLAGGSFYLIFKLQYFFKISYFHRLEQFYGISLLMNLAIILLAVLFMPDLICHQIFLCKSFLIISCSLVCAGMIGIFYVKIEAWLCGTKKTMIRSFVSKQLIITVMLIGVTEEVLFRGLMNGISCSFHGIFAGIGIILSIILFGGSHIFSGWIQFVSKTFLAILMDILFFLSGNICIPAIAHALFNFCVLKQYPKVNRNV